MKQFDIVVSLENYSINAIRYAAYTQTNYAWVYLSFAEKALVNVHFVMKAGHDIETVKSAFLQELEDEKIREKSRAVNVAASIEIIKNAFKNINVSFLKEEKSVLTKKQELELDKLIEEVEKELQSEMELNKSDDIKHITKTWEETNGK